MFFINIFLSEGDECINIISKVRSVSNRKNSFNIIMFDGRYHIDSTVHSINIMVISEVQNGFTLPKVC